MDEFRTMVNTVPGEACGMRRRELLAATATTLTIPFVAGCARDDGGGGGGGEDDDGGGGGPYGMVSAGDAVMASENPDGSDARGGSRHSGGPALGPEPRGPDGDD